MIDFKNIKKKYRENPLPILRELVGQGRIEGNDYVALNPRRIVNWDHSESTSTRGDFMTLQRETEAAVLLILRHLFTTAE